MDSHATKGAMERANCTVGELLRTMKHATETKVGGRWDADHPLISCVTLSLASMQVPRASKRQDASRSVAEHQLQRRACLCRRSRRKFEMNWLELVWLGKTEDSDEHLCGNEHGVRKFRTNR